MIKRLSKTLAFLLCALAYFGLAQRVSAQYRFDVWTTNDGLPQNNILNIHQTSDGYLWLATFDGLVRSDGVRFRVFNSGNTPGIKNSRFLMLFEDRQGALWISTEESGVTRYKDGQFATYTVDDGLPHNRISRTLRIREDSQGIVINTDGGPIRWKDGKIRAYDPNEGDGYAAMGFPARAGVVWCVDRAGLHRVEDARVTADVPAPWSSPAEIRRIFETPSGTVWIATADPNGQIWRLSQGHFTRMTGKDGLPQRWVTSICEDQAGNTWFGTAGAGLYRLRGERFTVFGTGDGLPSNDVNTVYEDREGNIWIGTTNGLCRLRERIVTALSTREGLAGDNVYPIYQDRSGAIWIGSWQGLSRYSNGTLTDYSKKFGLENQNVTAICEDHAGTLWVGTWSDAGVVRIQHGKIVPRFESETINGATHVIFEDHAGTLWFGTHNGLLSYRDGVVKRYGKKDGLPGDIVYALLEDRAGVLWIGTEGGLANFRGGSLRAFNAGDGMGAYLVRSLYQDDGGTIWIGTYDGGLYRFREGRFSAITFRDGLFNNGVFQILEDQRGYFWMGCNLGIYRVSRNELDDFADGRLRKVTAIAYGKNDGMLNPECNGGNQPAGIKAADGRLWFATAKGVAVIDPAKVETNSQPPRVVIDEVTVDNRGVNPREELRIEPGRENFEVAYTGLTFVDPERVVFRYRLGGLDSDWIEAGTRRTAYYSHVAPGAYTFEVMAANRDGVWSEQPARLRVVVVPPFWRTWWFTLLAAAAVLASATALYRRRISALRRAHLMQETFSRQLIESQEAERKRIAAELHDSLGQNLLVIKNRAMLATRTANDDTLEQLNEISSVTDQAIDEVSEISYNLRPYHLDRLGLTRAIEAMLRRVSGSSGILFSSAIDTIDGLLDQNAEISIYRIVQESVNNVVKHSGATEARVSVKKNSHEMEIVISDNGRGINSEAGANDSRPGGGFGLIGIAERARMLGGRHALQSATGSGTTLTVYINLPESQNHD